MNIFQKIAMGAGELDGYGDHPGWGMLFFGAWIGALGGMASYGWVGGLIGALVMLVFFGPLFLVGCVNRANSFLARARRQAAEKAKDQ